MICVYDMGNENFSNNGDAILLPKVCKHTQTAGGKYDLSMTHPVDAEGKWMHLTPEAIIKAPVPEETIESAFSGLEADLYRTTEAAALRSGPSEPTLIPRAAWSETTAANDGYGVGSQVSFGDKHYQCNFWDSEETLRKRIVPSASGWWAEIAKMTPGSPVLINMKSGADLYYISGPDGGWYKMSTPYGMEGYVKSSQVTYIRHLTPAETQPRKIKEQLFRIKTVNVDSKSRMVTVTAEHVSYDLAGVMVENADIHQKSPAFAMAMIESNFMIPYRGMIGTNMTGANDGTYTGQIRGKNAIYALLDPDKGIVASFDAMYRRDNWDVFVMKKVNNPPVSFRLRYRKNMMGASWNIKTDGLVTRVVPVAKDEEGNDFFLEDDPENDKYRWVDSAHISEYPVIYMEWLKVQGQVGKDDGTEQDVQWTEQTLRDEMQAKAEERFSVDKADLIVHEITVDFEMLGDTEEYKWLKGLEKVLMYDKVLVDNEEINLSVQVEVCEIEYDCIREKITALKLTNVSQYGGRTVSGFNVFNNSITGEKLTAECTEGIAEDAKEAAIEESKAYTTSSVYGLRAWVSANFEPKS